jgi:hypothetical protein
MEHMADQQVLEEERVEDMVDQEALEEEWVEDMVNQEALEKEWVEDILDQEALEEEWVVANLVTEVTENESNLRTKYRNDTIGTDFTSDILLSCSQASPAVHSLIDLNI